MARILAVDYGKKRTGLAVTDPLQLIAGGLCTVPTVQLIEYLTTYLSENEVETIVVGYPRQMNGEDSENMKRITPFVNRITKLFPAVRIEMFDERFTSVIAHHVMIDSGISRTQRRDKALVDKISATIILEDYLQSRL